MGSRPIKGINVGLGKNGRWAHSHSPGGGGGGGYTLSSLQSLEYFWCLNDINIIYPANVKAGGSREGLQL